MWSCWLYAEFSSCSVMKMIVIMMMVVQRFSQFINLLCSRWNPGFYGVAQNHSHEDLFHAYGSIMIYTIYLQSSIATARILLNYLHVTACLFLTFNSFFLKTWLWVMTRAYFFYIERTTKNVMIFLRFPPWRLSAAKDV